MSEGELGTAPRRRSRAAAERLVAEYAASGLSRREFCRQHELSVSTLDLCRKRRHPSRSEAAGGSRFVAVELSRTSQAAANGTASGLAVLLPRGRLP